MFQFSVVLNETQAFHTWFVFLFGLDCFFNQQERKKYYQKVLGFHRTLLSYLGYLVS